MSAKIYQLGPHNRMTPEEALAYAATEDWDTVLICGFHKDSDGALVMRSSHASREFALWIIEHAKLHIMDRL